MPDTNDALMAKVRKLLAVNAAAGATEAEAATAATLVQNLLTAHNLTMAQVEAAAPQAAAKRTKAQSDRAAMYKYQQTLMAVLAANNFCKHFLVTVKAESFGKTRSVKRHVILGREANVQVTLLTYDYLIAAMDRLLPYTGMEKRGKDALLWLEGCTDRLTHRLRQKRREAEQASPAPSAPGGAPGTALTLVDVYASEESLNEDFHRGLPAGTTAARQAANEAAREARMAEVRAKFPGETTYVQQLLASGYTLEEARKWDKHWDSRRYRESSARRYAKAQERRSAGAYRSGYAAGDEIGLDDQVRGPGEGAPRIGGQ